MYTLYTWILSGASQAIEARIRQRPIRVRHGWGACYATGAAPVSVMVGPLECGRDLKITAGMGGDLRRDAVGIGQLRIGAMSE
jgi:hypothetical protein